MADDVDTSRTTVKTYVPAYQKAEWGRHADRLDMSQSEFVRTMVQVGRRDFEIPDGGGRVASADDEPPESADGTDAGALDDRVVAALSDGPLSWDELLTAVTDDLEDRLDATLQRLQSENRVQYSGRDGGYRLVDDE
ncbi:MAG: DUF5805 domain-containing protein [Haloarculaceae archaeon]